MRLQKYLLHRYAVILSYSGMVLAILGALLFTPLLVAIAYPRELVHAGAFVLPALALCVVGSVLWRVFRPPQSVTLTRQEGGVIVLVSWVGACVFSTWPLMEILHLSFSRALFETVSAWTTTGLSIVDVTAAGEMILVWRSTMQLVGGAGFAIIMTSTIIGPLGVGLASAEGRSDQLVPSVRQSSKLVLILYSAYTVIGFVAYWVAGMSPFDAVNHVFAAVSTGGFSTHVESIGYWDSVTVEAITLPLMVMGNLSFVTAWYLWRRRFRQVSRDGEVRVMAFVVPVATAILFLFTSIHVYPMLGKAIRVAVFETTSALTTTGFSTVGYSQWNSVGVFLLVVLMLIGGGTCSTAGGIKQFRVYVLWKALRMELGRALKPSNVVVEQSIWEGARRKFVGDDRVREISMYTFLYAVTLIVGTTILTGSGYSIGDSLFEFASALGTVGLSVGVSSPTMPDAALWAETIAMFLGRLEFFVVFASIVKIARDARAIVFSTSNTPV